MDTMALSDLKDPDFEASRRVLKLPAPIAKLAPGSGSFARRLGSFVTDFWSLPLGNMLVFSWILNGLDGGQTPSSRIQHKKAGGRLPNPEIKLRAPVASLPLRGGLLKEPGKEF